jgi:hypothetical protein
MTLVDIHIYQEGKGLTKPTITISYTTDITRTTDEGKKQFKFISHMQLRKH